MMFSCFKKIHKHVFIYNRTEVMINFGNIANEFVVCLQFILDKSILKKKHVFLHICLYNSRTNCKGRNRVRWSAAQLSNESALPRTTDSTP